MWREYSTTHPARTLYPVSVLPQRVLSPVHQLDTLFKRTDRAELFPCEVTTSTDCDEPAGVHLGSARHQVNAVNKHYLRACSFAKRVSWVHIARAGLHERPSLYPQGPPIDTQWLLHRVMLVACPSQCRALHDTDSHRPRDKAALTLLEPVIGRDYGYDGDGQVPVRVRFAAGGWADSACLRVRVRAVSDPRWLLDHACVPTTVRPASSPARCDVAHTVSHNWLGRGNADALRPAAILASRKILHLVRHGSGHWRRSGGAQSH